MEVIMSIRDFFARKRENVSEVTSEATNSLKNADAVVCDTAELKNLITKWTQNEGWKFGDFVTFVELTGVKTPIKLSEWDEEKHSFKCITALNTEVTMSIRFGDRIDFCSELWVTDGEETRRYITNRNCEKGKTIPKVTLKGRTITRDGKELSSYYCEYSCHRTLKLDETHTLKIEIDEPCNYDEKSEIFVLRNCANIEEYLLGLDNSLNIAQVYEKLIGLLSFSKEDISNSEKILITYVEIGDKEEKTRSKILINKGKMQEYEVIEDGETFHVLKNGEWKYLSDDGIWMVYLAEKKHYVFSITGSENQIMTTSPAEILSRVKLKISELWKFEK